jgi:hypothetical protein
MAGQITSNPLSLAPNMLHPLIQSPCSWNPSSENPWTFLLSNSFTSGIVSNVRWIQWLPYNQSRCWTIPTFFLWGTNPCLTSRTVTDTLRAILNAGPVGDGQTVWTNIVTEAKKSMTACISSQLLTAYLTTSKIRDGSWWGTDTANLNHWNKQMQILTTGMNSCASSWNIPRRHLWQMILSLHCSRMLFRTLHTWQAWSHWL